MLNDLHISQSWVITQNTYELFSNFQKSLSELLVASLRWSLLCLMYSPMFLTKFDSQVDFNMFHAKSENLFEVLIVNLVILLDVEVCDEFWCRWRFVAVQVSEFCSFCTVLFWLDNSPFTVKKEKKKEEGGLCKSRLWHLTLPNPQYWITSRVDIRRSNPFCPLENAALLPKHIQHLHPQRYGILCSRRTLSIAIEALLLSRRRYRDTAGSETWPNHLK